MIERGVRREGGDLMAKGREGEDQLFSLLDNCFWDKGKLGTNMEKEILVCLS